jgi:thiosulfate dehydrogenase
MSAARVFVSVFVSCVVLGGGLLAGLAGCSDGEAPEPIKIYGGTAIDHGAALFHDPSLGSKTLNSYSCSTCHEAKAGEAGAAILPGAPLAGVTKRTSFWGGQEVELLRSINHCLYYFMLSDKAWKAEDEEARAMYAYLESLPADDAAAQPAPFTIAYEVKNVPEGDGARGKGLYVNACESCHGPAHTGEGRLVQRAPILPEQTIDEHPSPQYDDLDRRLVFVEKVRHGGFIGYGGEMPPFSVEKLSDQDLSDILAFLGVP